MEQDLRRTREKLKTMVETPHLHWILADLIDLLDEEYFGLESPWLGAREKAQLVERLKNRYEKFIKDNEKPVGRQGLLGI